MNIFVEKSRELMREKGVTLSGNAVENLVRAYASIVIGIDNNLDEYPEEYWCDEDCPEWMYDNGYKNGMERWLNAIGISPASPYVQSFIDEERENRKED